MRIRVKLFAILREKAGISETELELPTAATVAAAARAIGAKFPAIAGVLPKIAFAVNHQYVDSDTPLNDGDELALIPAVSGGAGDCGDWAAIVSDALPVAEATAFVSDPGAGAIAVFMGVTRRETGPANQSLIALDYEAYEPMAVEQFREFSREARRRWPVVKLVILHRIGRVGVNEPSVLIAVSTPHRKEAFEACQWMIDTLKGKAAIWKKQVWSDGPANWV